MPGAMLLQGVPVGEYISIGKIIPVLLVLLVWLRLLTWADKDSTAAHLWREMVMLGMGLGLAAAMALFILLPGFWIAFPVFFFIFLAEVGVYLLLRHQKVGLADLKKELGNLGKMFQGGGKRRKAQESLPGIVSLATRDGKPITPPQAETADRVGYDTLQLMLTDPMLKGMERIDLLPVEGSVLVQYWVDGVGYNGAQFNKAAAASAIGYAKLIARMDVNERRKPQTGSFRASVDKRKVELQVETKGSATGETMRLMVAGSKAQQLPIEQMGMTQTQIDTIRSVISESGGVVLITAPLGQGLTTMEYALLRQHDAFLSHIQTIEREPESDLEGITQNKLPRTTGAAEELEKAAWVVSQEPDCILIDSIQNPKTAREVISHAASGRRAYVGMRAASAMDAVAEWQKLVGDDALAMSQLRLVVAGRVYRQLCAGCKVAYQPDPEMLRKLNFDAGRVQQLFQARTQPVRDQKGNLVPCGLCHDLRYHGRSGVYEVMVMSDEMRQAVLAGATPDQLRKLYRKQRGRFLQENALDRVEEGLTSIQEVSRVMRGQDVITTAPGAGKTPAAIPAPGGTQGPGGTQPGIRPGTSQRHK
jgi:type II secretory ATPase GspE/PulE/Tfp pilus assembly ATPase PilB-like protein